MKDISLSPLPRDPGIYTLINTKAGYLYIGQSMNLARRLGNWITYFASKTHGSHPHLDPVLATTDPADWEFKVMFHLPGVKAEELRRYEHKAIFQAEQKYPGQVLNFHHRTTDVKSKVPLRPGRRGRTPKIKVVDREGIELERVDVARHLGVTVLTLHQRLYTFRGHGVEVICVDELINRSNKYGTNKFRKPKIPEWGM